MPKRMPVPSNPNVIDSHFKPNELLFRRIRPNGLQAGRVALDEIDMPDMSCNRSKYSVAAEMISAKNFQGWGVASFAVLDIPAEIPHPTDGRRHTFKPIHQPEKNNYAHTEVQAFVDGVHLNSNSPDYDLGVSTRFRMQMQMRMRIVIGPNMGAAGDQWIIKR